MRRYMRFLFPKHTVNLCYDIIYDLYHKTSSFPIFIAQCLPFKTCVKAHSENGTTMSFSIMIDILAHCRHIAYCPQPPRDNILYNTLEARPGLWIKIFKQISNTRISECVCAILYTLDFDHSLGLRLHSQHDTNNDLK